jgi:hypothetical protein
MFLPAESAQGGRHTEQRFGLSRRRTNRGSVCSRDSLRAVFPLRAPYHAFTSYGISGPCRRSTKRRASTATK